jgi:WD40 repeat protein
VFAPEAEKDTDTIVPIFVYALDRPMSPPIQLQRHRGGVRGLVLLVGGSRMVSASKEAVCVWDLSESHPQCQQLPTGDMGDVWSVLSSPSGRYITAWEFGADWLAIWDMNALTPTASRRVLTCTSRATFDEHETFAVCKRKHDETTEIVLTPLVPAGPSRTVATLGDYLGGLDVDAHSRLVASGDWHGGAFLADLTTGTTTRLETPSFDDRDRLDEVAFLNHGFVVFATEDHDYQDVKAAVFQLGKATPWQTAIQARFDQRGELLVTTMPQRPPLLWTLAKGPQQKARELYGLSDRIGIARFSRTSRWLVTTNAGKTFLWDLAKEEAWKFELTGNTGAIAECFFDAKDETLVTLSKGDDVPRLWDLRKRNPVAIPGVVEGHAGPYTSYALSADGRWLAAGQMSGSDAPTPASVWNLAGDDPATTLVQLVGHKGHVNEVKFSPDSSVLLTGGRDETVRTWDVARAAAVQTYPAPGGVTSIAFSRDGSRIVVAGDRGAQLWRVDGRTLRDRVDAWSVKVLDAAFAPDGTQLALAPEKGSVVVVDLGSMTSRVLEGLAGVRVVTYSHGGTWLVAGGTENHAMLWRLPDYQPFLLPNTKRHDDDEIAVAAFSADDAWLAIGSKNGGFRRRAPHEARLYALRPDGPHRTFVLSGIDDDVKAVAFTGDDRLLTASYDATIRVWDLTAPDPSFSSVKLPGHSPGDFTFAAVSADDRWFVAGGFYRVRIFPNGAGALLGRAASAIGRNLSRSEWEQFLPGEPHRRTIEFPSE